MSTRKDEVERLERERRINSPCGLDYLVADMIRRTFFSPQVRSNMLSLQMLSKVEPVANGDAGSCESTEIWMGGISGATLRTMDNS